MPEDDDTDKCNCRWGAKDVLLIVTTVSTLLMGFWNKEKINTVGENQTAAVQKAEEVKDTLNASTAQRNKQLDKIEQTTEKTEKAVTDTVGPQLMASWLYLKSISDENPTTENLKRTNEAKAALDKHRAPRP
jgi:outer membrane phospholipase A